MGFNRNTTAGALVVLALWVGWSTIRSAEREVAVLRTFDFGGSDQYTPLWVLDDGHYVWIRANRPDRRWLEQLRAQPDVELKRGGRSRAYRAAVFPGSDARDHVSAGFRRKYGLADRWREWQDGRHSVPVRLEPR